jgi:hypothetical protein
MERFNSNETLLRSFKDEAKDIIYSDLNDGQKVIEIINVQKTAFIDGQNQMRQYLHDCMDGVVFVDREFIEKAISNIPIIESE